MKLNIKQPTAEECNDNIKVYEDEELVGYAVWYPQINGYGAKCVCVFDKKERAIPVGLPDLCFEVFIWHDGNFAIPTYDNDTQPIHIHHCSTEQFINFGENVLKAIKAEHGLE